MHNLSDMHEQCKQCNFNFARIDTEGWGNNSARRVMCPVCGWTMIEEHTWKEGQPELVQRCESRGFGAYRLVPTCGFSGYNAFHSGSRRRDCLSDQGATGGQRVERVPDPLGRNHRPCTARGGQSAAAVKCGRQTWTEPETGLEFQISLLFIF